MPPLSPEPLVAEVAALRARLTEVSEHLRCAEEQVAILRSINARWLGEANQSKGVAAKSPVARIAGEYGRPDLYFDEMPSDEVIESVLHNWGRRIEILTPQLRPLDDESAHP